MSANRRTPRDVRRRRLGQNFLRAEVADRIVGDAGVLPGEFVIDMGAGAFTLALAVRHAEVVAIELDPVWADRLRARLHQVHVVNADFLDVGARPAVFRVVGCIPFGETTAILHRLLDDPSVPLVRADLVVQWEVAEADRGSSVHPHLDGMDAVVGVSPSSRSRRRVPSRAQRRRRGAYDRAARPAAPSPPTMADAVRRLRPHMAVPIEQLKASSRAPDESSRPVG